MTAKTVDLVRSSKDLYSPGRDPAIVEVPEFTFLMVDGHGDPNVAPGYQQAVEALFAVSYTLKFALKRGPQQLDYRVMPLEGLWWAPDMSTFTTGDKSAWDWTMMVRQPSDVDSARVEDARAAATRRRELPAADLVRLERFAEGKAAQVMHIGPYSTEGPAIERLHAFIAEQGCELVGKHHEIYLGDPRRAAPDRLKTVLRQAMAASR